VGVLALGSVRSCGVSTLALALTVTWPPGRRVLLIEADPAGGTLAAASGWPPEPGLVSLAAASRRRFDPALVSEHCQVLPGGAAVLAGPASADQARGALGMLGGMAGHLDGLDADVVVDCGRLDPGSLSMPVWEGADRRVLLARLHLADLHALAAWAETRQAEGHPTERIRAGLVVVGDGPYPDAEIAEALDVEVLSRLPWDPRGAAAIVSVLASSREVRLAPLVRAARTLPDRLAAEIGRPLYEPAAEHAPATMPAARLATRVLRAWRLAPVGESTNGAAPEEVPG
jgi:hypothetical protein